MRSKRIVSVWIAALLGVGLTAGIAGAQTVARDALRAEYRSVREVQTRNTERILALPGVVGVGTMLSHRDLQKVVIGVYVSRSTPELAARISALVGDAPVEILETTGFRAR